jgi:hypothetical protein
MTVLYAGAVALLSIAAGVAHSIIGERRIFQPLSREEQHGALAYPRARPILRVVWHLPSLIWPLLGVTLLVARLNGGDIYVTVIAAAVFGISGLGNLIGLRQPHPGGLTLLAMAALVLADWRLA